jgi:hypothetical protein
MTHDAAASRATRATVTRRAWVVAATAAVWLALSATSAAAELDVDLTERLIDRVEAERTEAGLDPLVYATNLQEVAEAWAIQLIREGAPLRNNPQVGDQVCCDRFRSGDGGGEGTPSSSATDVTVAVATDPDRPVDEVAASLFDSFLDGFVGQRFITADDRQDDVSVGLAVGRGPGGSLAISAVYRRLDEAFWGTPPEAWPRPQVLSVDEACDDPEPSGFGDVPAGNVHARAIDCVGSLEITQGTTATTFEPTRTVDRGQMAAFLVRLLEGRGVELPEADGSFEDVAGTTHETAIGQLAEAGIVQGGADGLYRPSAPVTRAQMATFLVRSYAVAGGSPDRDRTQYDYFVDDWTSGDQGPGSTHGANIQRVAEIGVTGGAAGPVGFYDLDSRVTRDQMASFLSRLVAAIDRL